MDMNEHDDSKIATRFLVPLEAVFALKQNVSAAKILYRPSSVKTPWDFSVVGISNPLSLFVCICMCMYIYVCVCMYMYIIS